MSQFHLNPAQQEAVLFDQGPCLVLAGAGSGKTRVITEKIVHLIQHKNYQPQEIVAITFTNKAAHEMQTRVKPALTTSFERMGKKPRGQVNISTFHSLGLRLLRHDAKHLGFKENFSILDSADCKGILQDILGENDKKNILLAQSQISTWKNKLISPDEALRTASHEETARVASAYGRYCALLNAYHAVDFDDLILQPVRLLREHAAVREHWQRRWQYILVDEYQDTNGCQYELLKLLVNRQGLVPRFTVVGDDDQSIYGWRGANADNLLLLQQEYPDLKIIKLEQNYRSSNNILKGANELIAHNPKLFIKNLWSEHSHGQAILVLPMKDEEHEAESVVFRLSSMRFELGNQWRDYAILYRSNHQARIFEKVLRRENIPYRISGGQSFFEKAEIKDMLAYLRLLVNPDDDPAFLRAITTPKRGVGSQTLISLGELAAQSHTSLFQAAQSGAAISMIGASQRQALENFIDFIQTLTDELENQPVDKTLDQLLQGIDYEAYLYEQFDDRQAQNRWSSVLELMTWLKQKGTKSPIEDAALGEEEKLFDTLDDEESNYANRDGLSVKADKNLPQLVQTVALMNMLENRAQDDDQNAIQLSTIHASKGLEFGHVIIIGVEENTLPFVQNNAENEAERDEETISNAVMEERRIMYVGVTRAQKSLTITWCSRRKRGGEQVACEPSRFIAEMGLANGRDHSIDKPQVVPQRHLANLKALLAKPTHKSL